MRRNSAVAEAKAKGLTHTLVWSSKASAAYYELEIASDANFSQPVPGSPYRAATFNMIRYGGKNTSGANCG